MLKPAPVSRDGLLATLDDIRDHVARGDSFEGFLNYTMPEPDDPDDVEFRLEARYRVGNLQGQGGMRIIGDLVEEDVDVHVSDTGYAGGNRIEE
jgi:hypothetical protein